jgi:hypothetical protein
MRCPPLPEAFQTARSSHKVSLSQPPVSWKPSAAAGGGTGAGGGASGRPAWSIFFIVVAHTNTLWNCKLLWQTLESIDEYHGGEPILLVDNDSPRENLQHALPPHVPLARIARCVPSKGMLGALEIGARVLQEPEFESHPWEQVILMQHSTWLVRPLPPVKLGCPLVALQGSFARQEGHCALYDLREYECPIAREALRMWPDLPCPPKPGRASRPNGGGDADGRSAASDPDAALDPELEALPTLRWASVWHGVLQFAPEGWRKFARLGIIAQSGNRSTPVGSVRHMWKAILKGKTGFVIRNQGWERLAGMLVAYLQTRAGSTVGGAKGELTCSHGHNYHLHKRHGESHSLGIHQYCRKGPVDGLGIDGTNFANATRIQSSIFNRTPSSELRAARKSHGAAVFY